MEKASPEVDFGFQLDPGWFLVREGPQTGCCPKAGGFPPTRWCPQVGNGLIAKDFPPTGCFPHGSWCLLVEEGLAVKGFAPSGW
jgi:hypothetical protein